MKFRTTLILLVVFAVLGGYLFWSGRGSPAGTDATATPTVSVLQINSADVGAIVVRDAAGKQVRAEHNGGTWRLAAPKPVQADAATITTALDSLAKLSATRTVTPTTQDLAPYGLARPAYTLQLFKGGTTLAELRIGSKNPDGSATYVQRAGEPAIYLVSDPVLGTVEGWPGAPPVPTAPSTTSTPASR